DSILVNRAGAMNPKKIPRQRPKIKISINRAQYRTQGRTWLTEAPSDDTTAEACSMVGASDGGGLNFFGPRESTQREIGRHAKTSVTGRPGNRRRMISLTTQFGVSNAGRIWTAT